MCSLVNKDLLSCKFTTIKYCIYVVTKVVQSPCIGNTSRPDKTAEKEVPTLLHVKNGRPFQICFFCVVYMEYRQAMAEEQGEL